MRPARGARRHFHRARLRIEFRRSVGALSLWADRARAFKAKEVVAAQARNQQGRLQSDGSNSSFPSGSAADSEDSELVYLVARALNVLRRSTGWVFWVRSGDHSILPMLADLASKWHDTAMKQDTHADHLSLRVTLFWGIITNLKEKLSQLTQEQIAYATRTSWIDSANNWNFQKQDSQHQMLIVDTSRPTLSTVQILESLSTLLRVINGNTFTRFAATTGISESARTRRARSSSRRTSQSAGERLRGALHGADSSSGLGDLSDHRGAVQAGRLQAPPPLIQRIQRLLG